MEETYGITFKNIIHYNFVKGELKILKIKIVHIFMLYFFFKKNWIQIYSKQIFVGTWEKGARWHS